MKFDRSLLSGSTRLLVLALLAEGDCYGYQIIRTLARRSEEVFAFQEGTLYPVLHKLEQDGCVRSYEKESEGRRRRYYTLTGRGRKQLEEEKAQWRTFQWAVDRVIGGAAYGLA